MFVYVGGNSTTSPCLTEEPATDRYFKVGIIKIFMYVVYMDGNMIKSIDNLLYKCIRNFIFHYYWLPVRSTYNKKGSTQSSYRFYYKAVESGNPTFSMEKEIPNSFAQVSEEQGKRSFSHHRYSDFSADDPTQLQNRPGHSTLHYYNFYYSYYSYCHYYYSYCHYYH